MERYKIQVEAREKTGKGVARRLRRSGLIPGVVYGKNRDSLPLALDPGKIITKLHENAIFDLTIVSDDEKEEEIVMIKDYQKDVIKGNVTHVDFQQISMDEKIAVTVPVKILGDAIGVKEGGVVQQLMREVEIEALPINVPDELELDISELNIGDSLQVSDLAVSEDVDILDSLDEVIITVVAPSEEIEEEVEEVDEDFIEPEVIGEEDEEEEEEPAEEPAE